MKAKFRNEMIERVTFFDSLSSNPPPVFLAFRRLDNLFVLSQIFILTFLWRLKTQES